MQPFYKDGTHGQNPHRYAGDKVEINDKWKITVNGDVVGEGSSSQETTSAREPLLRQDHAERE